MFGNFKEFISVVQNGLTSNSNLWQSLEEVQKVKNIFRDRQKVPVNTSVNYSAGGALLEKYQDQWAELHENADNNAKAADEVDRLILEIHESTKAKLNSANELSRCLSSLPNLTASVAQCMDSLKNVTALLEAVEEELVNFEDIVERSKMESWKLDHHYHLSLYKEKKLLALEDIRSELAKKNTEEYHERERQQLAELQARRDNSSAAFKQDMTKFRTSGSIPSNPCTSSEITLDQVQLEEDRSELEKFLDA
ncbi:hypothetical protein ACJJTC_008191 [Scirpophaga incertulas]